MSERPLVRSVAAGDAEPWVRFVAIERARTYAGAMPPSFAQRLLVEVPTAAAHLRDELTRGVMRYALAELGGEIVGAAEAGPAPAEWEVELGFVPAPADVELHLLYLRPDHHGTGLADRLLSAVLDPGPAYLWLIAGNERAERFYLRRGFASLLEQVSAGDTWGNVTMHRMVRD